MHKHAHVGARAACLSLLHFYCRRWWHACAAQCCRCRRKAEQRRWRHHGDYINTPLTTSCVVTRLQSQNTSVCLSIKVWTKTNIFLPLYYTLKSALEACFMIGVYNVHLICKKTNVAHSDTQEKAYFCCYHNIFLFSLNANAGANKWR